MPDQPQDSGPAPVFSYRRQGRSLTAAAAAAAWAALLLLLGFGMQAAPWLVILLALPLLPVLWDLWRNPAAGLMLDNSTLSWFTSGQQGKAELAGIDKVRFDTRWDFSVRATLVLDSGRKLRRPQACLPPHRELEAELSRRGLRCERHHFTVF